MNKSDKKICVLGELTLERHYRFTVKIKCDDVWKALVAKPGVEKELKTLLFVICLSHPRAHDIQL